MHWLITAWLLHLRDFPTPSFGQSRFSSFPMLSVFMALYFCRTTLQSWREVKTNCLATLEKGFPPVKGILPITPEETQTHLLWGTRILALGLWSLCMGELEVKPWENMPSKRLYHTAFSLAFLKALAFLASLRF